MAVHFKKVCTYGKVHSQCRCASREKFIMLVDCDVPSHRPPTTHPQIVNLVEDPHDFDPGGRAHWIMPRCAVCQLFEDHPVHRGEPTIKTIEAVQPESD
jgi:hypothetical protein